MVVDAPKFPYSYPVDDVYDDDEDPARDYLITLTEQAAKRSFAWLHPEVQRRFIAVQLKCYEAGIGLGVGTGWRVQPLVDTPNHAKNGNSNHQAFPWDVTPPVTPEHGAIAIDTIGTPSDAAAWSEMEKHLRECGLYNFDPGGGAHATNIDGVPYRGSWDRPHVQPFEVPDSRNFRKTPFTLRHWDLEPKYDIEVVGLDPFAHPLWGGDNPTPEEHDMTDEQAAQLSEIARAVTATNTTLWEGDESVIGRLEKLKWLPTEVEQIKARLDALEQG